jgi:hypothetical protein
MENRKKAVSIRMSAPDVRNVKKLAKRLGVRDSDVIRYAVKVTLRRLAPLYDTTIRGRRLVPVFVDAGRELCRHFDLDALRLESIINEGAPDDARVDADDIQLMVLSGLQPAYLKLRFNGYHGEHHAGATTNDADGDGDEATQHALRSYLFEKYLNGSRNGAHPAKEMEVLP